MSSFFAKSIPTACRFTGISQTVVYRICSLRTHPLQPCQYSSWALTSPNTWEETSSPRHAIAKEMPCPVPSIAFKEYAGQNMSTQRRTQRWLCGLCPQHAFVPPQLYTMYLGVALNFWYPLMTCRAHSRPEHHHLSATKASHLLHFVKAVPMQPGWLHNQVIIVQVPCQPGMWICTAPKHRRCPYSQNGRSGSTQRCR